MGTAPGAGRPLPLSTVRRLASIAIKWTEKEANRALPLGEFPSDYPSEDGDASTIRHFPRGIGGLPASVSDAAPAASPHQSEVSAVSVDLATMRELLNTYIDAKPCR